MDFKEFCLLHRHVEEAMRQKMQTYKDRLYDEAQKELYRQLYAAVERDFQKTKEAEMRTKLIAELRPIVYKECAAQLRETIHREERAALGKERQAYLNQDIVDLLRK